MNRMIVLLLLLAAGCAPPNTRGSNSAVDNYYETMAGYCKDRSATLPFDACMAQIKNGYLTNQEYNYLNEKTKWWTRRPES